MLPLGIVMTLLMGITHVLGWKKTSFKLLWRNVLIPAILATIATVVVVVKFPYKFPKM